MSNLNFIRKLYNGKNCYSDHMTNEELQVLHVHSKVEDIILEMQKQNKIVFLTGNPGDGKTFLIRTIEPQLTGLDVYIETDLNKITDYQEVAEKIITCYKGGKPAIIAVNEYPFIRLCKQIRKMSSALYEEITTVKQNAIIYDMPHDGIRKVAVIDLNERNLLDKDHNLSEEIITRICALLDEDDNKSKQLTYNIKAMCAPEIRGQLVSLLDLASISCEHFAVRDIFGAISFILTACETEDFLGIPYYDAIFVGNNALLQMIQQFDPIYLSKPSVDEALWNGEIKTNWMLGVPEKWPNSPEFDDKVEEATELFKSIKRRYYFENSDGEALRSLQPTEIQKCVEMFVDLEHKKKAIKERLVRSINKLFLPSSDDKKQLRIWTTHRYDLSIDASTAISSRYVDTSDLDIQMPRPADWLNGIEYMPQHLILKPKRKESPTLIMDIDFLRTLDAIEDGYPVNLLAPQYAQTVAVFLQQLYEAGLAEENDDGEILIASRKRSYKRSIFIEDGKYSFEEADE